MTNEEIIAIVDATLADLADARYHYRQTTVGYKSNPKGCKHNWTIPPAGTEWSKGDISFDAATIKQEELKKALATLPPPVPPGVDAFKGLNCYRDADLALAANLTGCQSVRLEMPSAARVQVALNSHQSVLPIAMVSGDPHTPPADPVAWAAKIAGLYATDWQKPRALEVWNEPWGTGFWPPTPNPAAYLRLVKAVAAAVWAINKDCLILVSSDVVGNQNTSGTIEWLSNLLAADTDGFLADPRIRPTVHNYNNSTDVHRRTDHPCWWDFDRYTCVYQAYVDHGHPKPLVWCTEWACGYGNVRNFTDAQQAAYTVEGIKTMQASGKVEASYNYFFKTAETGGDAPFNWLTTTSQPRSVCAAVKAL